MIQIESLRIANFRGIKQLLLSFDKKNFGICGPNGTGKSGLVDAIEFALTGSITRLTGQGTGGLSVKAHAPHVDTRDQPQKSVVALTAYSPVLNQQFTIERRVSAPSKPKIDGATADVERIVKQLADHPEFALSRREILKYVIAEPGDRSREVQALLKIDTVDKVRACFQTVVNGAKGDLKQAESAVANARGMLLTALKIEEVKAGAILAAANERRQQLGLAALTDLTKDTSLKVGVGAPPKTGKGKANKALASEEIAAFAALIAEPPDDALRESVAAARELLQRIADNPQLTKSLQQRSFLQSGLTIIDEAYDETCPFCGSFWDFDELRTHVTKRLSDAAEAADVQRQLERSLAPAVSRLRAIAAHATTLVNHARTLDSPSDVEPLLTWQREVQGTIARFETAQDAATLLHDLGGDWDAVPAEVRAKLKEVADKVAALPEPAQEDEAKEFLIVAQERLEAYQKTLRQQDLSKKRLALATTVAGKYTYTSNAVLTRIYQEVEQDFSRYYATINKEDEADFRGKLTPSLGKLGFEVDFYNRGFFPPGAYHSEGHQDGMGLCLYLALMKRIMGTDFRFAVLDDVLMSVDSGHRKEVCNLLKSEFPATQFIFTTHDRVWLQHMMAEGLVTSKSVLEFRKWSPEDGPHVWQFEDVWKEIERDLNDNNIPGAAHTLRRYLEYVGADLSARLRAQVEFRSGASYDLGDLWPSVVGQFGKVLGRAKDAASSWGQKDKVDRLKAMHEDFKAKQERSRLDQWEINAGVHYNEWANLQKQDFMPVAKSFEELINCFKCPTCASFLYVLPPKGNAELLRGDCGEISFNLKKKS